MKEECQNIMNKCPKKTFSLEKKNQWNQLEFLYLSPEVRANSDNFKVYLWHPTKNKVYIDNFTISVLIPH